MDQTTMQARRLLLLAPLALFGCQKDLEECGKYSWSLCAYTGATDETTSVEPTTSQLTESPAECGDGVVAGVEECDDENDDGKDGCVKCLIARCGDEAVQTGIETCDAGDAKNTVNPWEMEETCKADCAGFSEYCGDGVMNGPEVCDSGADNSDIYTGKAHCDAECTAQVAFCGDGICQAQESLMQCPGDCKGTCGDGEIQAGEQCDEGLDAETCDGDCSFSSCGDGYANAAANEQCDDGNQVDTDACVTGCTNAVCGDGVIQAGVEDCEDGNLIDDDECSNTCIAARRVFVTSELFAAGTIKGVAGADLLCQTAAKEVPGLGEPGNTWFAWLSDDNLWPAKHFPAANIAFTGWYLLPEGTPVVKGWNGLTSGTLVNPISSTEAGVMPLALQLAWTNTKTDGTNAGANNCSNWTKSNINSPGGYGEITKATAAWTQAMTADCGTSSLRLYCIEVSP